MENPIEKLACEIVDEGVEDVFGVLGSGGSIKLVRSLVSKGVRFHHTYSEASASIMAGTVGWLSKRAGVSVAIKGPGLSNMVPGIVLAHFENYPLITIVENYGTDTPLSVAHKRISHRALVESITKECFHLNSGQEVFRRAKQVAESDTPGPVLVNLSDGITENSSKVDLRRRVTHIDERFYNCIKEKKKPIVIIGAQARKYSGVLGCIRKLKVPVFTTAAGKGIIDEIECYSAGVYTGVGRAKTPEYGLIPKADLIIGISLRESEVLSATPFHCRSIHINSAQEPEASGFGFDYEIGPEQAGPFLDSLVKKEWGSQDIIFRKEVLKSELVSSTFSPTDVMLVLSEQFGRKIRLVVDTGLFCVVAEHAFSARYDGHYISASNSRYMGVGLSAAIGTAIYDRSKKTVLVVGDGGIGAYISELKLAVHNKLNMLIILASDGGYGSIRANIDEDRLNDSLLERTSPSWLRIFDGFDIPGTSVASREGLTLALERSSKLIGPSYLECQFDPIHYRTLLGEVR